MTIGLSTYSFFWQWHPTCPEPIDLHTMVDKTADLGATLLQICDYPLVESFDPAALRDLKAHGDRRGVAFELGTRGVTPAHLGKYLSMARALDVTLVRSMLNTADHRPARDEAVRLLREVMPAYEAAGVTIALETYEQVPTATLIDVVSTVDSPDLGICLDPANCVAALEHPADVVESTAPYVRNIHVKDFGFSRRDGWVGFTLAGSRLGEGLLDYAQMIAAVRPEERGINQIIEHWLPWQGDSATTIAMEDRWTAANLNTLRTWEKMGSWEK